MRIRILLDMLALLAMPAAAVAAQDLSFGQVILENRASFGADLYVDSAHLCHAPPHSECIAEVSAGMHIAVIRFSDGDYIISDPFDVPEGMSITLPVVDLMT